MTQLIAEKMYQWVSDLFPLCRSITGNGIRDTLKYLQSLLPELTIHEVPSGAKAFDWVVPDEWNIQDAYVLDEHGDRVIDFQKNNLHVLGYSEPVDIELDLEELKKHLFSLPEMPNAIPYKTSYYKRRWGFCLEHNRLQGLKPGHYHAVVRSRLEKGYLTYGEIILPGIEKQEILLSTYICHPSMANNELSGPVVTTGLTQRLLRMRDRRYTYRIVFLPETIGSIVYLSRNLEAMKARTIAGYNVTCVGDERAWSFLPSRRGNTLADRAACHVLDHFAPDYIKYSFLQRGSDERQYCSPHIDLPVASVMRSKYCTYPEYHTSLDDLTLISPKGLHEAFQAYEKILLLLEKNRHFQSVHFCEPKLDKYGLFPTIRKKAVYQDVELLLNVLAYADGDNDLLDISELLRIPAWICIEVLELLASHGLVKAID